MNGAAIEPANAASTRRQIPLRETCAQPHECPKPMRMRILAQIPIFKGLSDADLEGIDSRMVSLSWAEGDHLYSTGDPATYLYVLAAGRAKAFHPTVAGQETIVDILAPGDIFGGFSVAGSPQHDATVEALATVCALRLETAVFREILLEYPEVALRVLDDMSSSLNGARSDVSRQSAATVAERVASTLLRLSDKFGHSSVTGSGTLIQLPLSRVDLAGMTGSTPESVSRVMSQLRKDGIIDSGRRWTSILDRERLAVVGGRSEPDHAPKGVATP